MDQLGLEAPNLATEPKATSDPVAPRDAPERDVILTESLPDAGPSVVKEGDLELEAAGAEDRYELRKRALGTASTQPINHGEDPHGRPPTHRRQGTMRSPAMTGRHALVPGSIL